MSQFACRIEELADGLERARREPDKVLCYVQALRRLALDLDAADLPPDLVRALRDPTTIIDRDRQVTMPDGRTLAEHIHEWANAPSNTASAD